MVRSPNLVLGAYLTHHVDHTRSSGSESESFIEKRQLGFLLNPVGGLLGGVVGLLGGTVGGLTGG
jgi:hypothetical protein